MIKSYQDLALDIPEDTEYTPVLCNVKLVGLTVGDKEVYGEVTAYMGYDESGDYYVPLKVTSLRLDDENGEPANMDVTTILDAMTAAQERFENYFERRDVREVE